MQIGRYTCPGGTPRAPKRTPPYAVRRPRIADPVFARRRMLAAAKCRRRSRLWPRYRPRARRDDEPADRKRAGLRRLALHRSVRRDGGIQSAHDSGRPNRHRAGPGFYHRNGRHHDPQRRDRLDRLHSLGCAHRAGRTADAAAAPDPNTGSDGVAVGCPEPACVRCAGVGRSGLSGSGICCFRRTRGYRFTGNAVAGAPGNERLAVTLGLYSGSQSIGLPIARRSTAHPATTR